MEKAGKSTQRKCDDDDIFAQYIATEIRSIEDPHVKRTVKWKIQSLIFSAHSSTYAAQHEAYSATPGLSWDYRRQGYPQGPYNQSRQGPSPTPSSVPSPHFPMPDFTPEMD